VHIIGDILTQNNIIIDYGQYLLQSVGNLRSLILNCLIVIQFGKYLIIYQIRFEAHKLRREGVEYLLLLIDEALLCKYSCGESLKFARVFLYSQKVYPEAYRAG